MVGRSEIAVGNVLFTVQPTRTIGLYGCFFSFSKRGAHTIWLGRHRRQHSIVPKRNETNKKEEIVESPLFLSVCVSVSFFSPFRNSTIVSVFYRIMEINTVDYTAIV
jgi:hypothetical protein